MTAWSPNSRLYSSLRRWPSCGPRRGVARPPWRRRAPSRPERPLSGQGRSAWRVPSAARHRPMPPSGNPWAGPSAADSRRRHLVTRGQMPLEHLEFLAVFQADDEIMLDRLLDRHRRRWCCGGRLRLGLARGAQRLKHAGDQGGNITHRHSIVADERGDDLRGQGQHVLLLAVVIHSNEPFDPSCGFRLDIMLGPRMTSHRQSKSTRYLRLKSGP